METTLKFEKVVLVKELNEKFRKVGEVFEIANVLDDSFLLRDSKTRVALGIVSFADFEQHFVHEANFVGWTQWTPFAGFDGQTDCFYRTNRKKTQVKFLTNNVRAESFLNIKEGDEFNLYFGIQLAYLRCLNKAYSKKAIDYENALKKINIEMIDNERTIEKMINSIPS
jgi:hypothetical protein